MKRQISSFDNRIREVEQSKSFWEDLNGQILLEERKKGGIRKVKEIPNVVDTSQECAKIVDRALELLEERKEGLSTMPAWE